MTQPIRFGHRKLRSDVLSLWLHRRILGHLYSLACPHREHLQCASPDPLRQTFHQPSLVRLGELGEIGLESFEGSVVIGSLLGSVPVHRGVMAWYGPSVQPVRQYTTGVGGYGASITGIPYHKVFSGAAWRPIRYAARCPTRRSHVCACG